jgi:hypothetical protein
MSRYQLRGRPPYPANQPPARRMDRHNNAIGPEIGRRARTTAEVVEGARRAIERAIPDGGTGQDGRAMWLPRRLWQPSAEGTAWPAIEWPSLEEAPHYRAYPGREAPPTYQRSDADIGGGPVHVDAHTRDGHAVRAHTRSLPAA